MFFGAALAYFVSVIERTSFGVASVEATERFGASAAVISTVAVVQVVVYAVLQIPVGVLADRIGAPPLVVAGAITMGVGQLVLALSEEFGWALLARVLVGAGDAFTFVSVIRLLPEWFEGPVLPHLTQWVGMLGQTGQIVSAFPVVFVLQHQGWAATYVTAAAVAGASALVAGAILRSGPGRRDVVADAVPSPAERRLVASLKRPGTQVGFWLHLIAGTVPAVLGILWGYPFLTSALGYEPGVASGIFTLMVIGTLASAPVIGLLVARHPLRRSDLVLGITGVVYVLWAAVLLWQPVPPIWLVASLFLVAGACSAASLVGLDVVRSFNPRHAHGSATGIANTGGFVGGFVAMLLIGLVLDVVDAVQRSAGVAHELYGLFGFRIAFGASFVLAIGAAVGVLEARRRTRRRLSVEQGITVAPLRVALRDARVKRRR